MNVPEINEVKSHLEKLKNEGIIISWELPYENLLTRRSAAIFFLTSSDALARSMDTLWDQFYQYENFSYRLNTEKKLSQLMYRLTFSIEEKEKNEKMMQATNLQ